ncbi:MAG: 2-dehydropantoate 2-reductase [bacterium]|nr:2-dehydropantoate 2-reductase [bacterium]MDT8396526.1 2-dehydropantoate 2-reductase [bacterium]
MRIAIIGAGSIGGYLAAKLLFSGQQVTVIVRGANLAAINANGLKLRLPDGTEKTATPSLATDDLAAAGPQDVVILGVKAQQLATVAPTLGPLLGPETAVVPAQNGIPWWYFQRSGGPFEGWRLESVDPGGVISKHIGPERVIGCVTYQAAELVEPGVVKFIEGNRFTLGEPDGEKSERVKALAQALTNAGLKVPIPRDIRTEIWVKVLGNMTFNPISALTRATLGEIIGFEPTRNLVADTMAEAQEVATRLGIRIGISIEKRIQGAAEMGSHKTSTLQDIEAGRTTEAECLVGAVAELGRLVEYPTPRIDTLYACLKLLEKTTCG